MKRIAIFGNAGSGKSTLARALAQEDLPVLDLDTIAWEPGSFARLRPQRDLLGEVERFCSSRAGWIVEGCYGDLIAAVLSWRPELIFMNPGEAVCLAHCRKRPWEPHKYRTKAEQDAHLQTLLAWVSAYYTGAGSLSLAGHRAIFDGYDGPKREILAPARR